MVAKNLACALSALLLAGAASNISHAQTAPTYDLVRSIPLGAPEHWDYLTFDAPSQRLFISHATEVTVVNVKSGDIVGHITGLMGSHGVAIDHRNGLGYADSGKDQMTTVFNLKTLKTVTKIPALEDADGMTFDPASNQVFVVGGDANAAIAYNPTTNKIAKTIALGGAPEFLAADGKGDLFVAINDKNEIVKINTKTNDVTARWPTAPCTEPTGMAVDAKTNRVFTSCRSGDMIVLDGNSGKIVATLPIGKGTDAAAFDDVRHRAFSSNHDGTLTVVSEKDANDFSVLDNVKTQDGARTLAVDPKSGDVYLVTAKVQSVEPPKTPGGYPHAVYVPGSLTLLVYKPTH